MNAVYFINSVDYESQQRLQFYKLFPKNLVRGLIVSVVVHLLVIGGYYAGQYLQSGEELPTVRVRLMKYSELGPPPSIMSTEHIPSVGVSVASVKPSVGIPVPVPDVEINPEQTIATQRELSEMQSPVLAEGTEGGGVVVEQDIQIEEEPEVDAFIPVEKNPMPVKQVKPEYPEIARRSGIEGTVWVKILVDKEGRAKKAVIIRSNAEILNDAAIQAALQWSFTPAIMNGGPVAVWVAVPFRFELHKQTL
ncbi:MAG: energy transducer TonB [Ignavibacteriae bacterium]|nr:energy transducer TonB [Ignavibacteriota bacterium]